MDALGEHWGISLPMFLDNFESVTNEIRATKAQQIRFIATQGASKLEIIKK